MLQLARHKFRTAPLFLALLATLAIANSVIADSSNRVTPLVRAVARARPSVVNLRGKKTIRPESAQYSVNQPIRQVNGMGTGVVIDRRGYVLTNFHVVEDVTRIQATLADGRTTTGQLIAIDHETDLALLKLQIDTPIAPMPLGVSTDLMLAETVAAVGNAYGYEHTVTRGIISELGRTVQVSDDQIYYDLIQTDAPINPGNSGGPLLNLEGDMIGINVAVRVGAQGIAFAIPVNDAIEIAARLLMQQVDDQVYLGFTSKTVYANHRPYVEIDSIRPNGPAAKAGLRVGDQLKSVNGETVARAIDVNRNLLDTRPGDSLELAINRRTSQVIRVSAEMPVKQQVDIAWQRLGVKVTPLGAREMTAAHPNYQKGLRIEQVRRGGAADREGIRAGDVLVAMHGYKTESVDNLNYVLRQPDINRGQQFKFYILRGEEPLWGRLQLSN